MYWYLISAMVLLAGPVYVIVAKRRAIAHTESWIALALGWDYWTLSEHDGGARRTRE